MSLRAYKNYRTTNIDWLGSIPSHWQLLPTKRFFRLVTEAAPNDNDMELLSVYTDIGVKPRKELEERGNRASTTDGYWMVKRGDLIVNKLLAWMGAIGMSEYDGVTSPAYDILRQSKPLEPRFYHYLFRCGICFTEFRRYSRGIMDMRLRLYFEQFGQLPMPFPPLDEQVAIASFLDDETSKIESLIAEQRRLIELLNEKIISLVLSSFHAAGTSDLRLSEASTIISRPVTQKAEESYTRIGLFNRGRGLFHKDASEMDDMGESDFFWVKEGDLIISGQFAWEGAVALADKEDEGCVVSHRYPVIRGKDGVALTEYLFGLLCTKHGDFLLNENSRGAAGRNRPLNISTLVKEKIPVPSMWVQEAVARAVHSRKALLKEIAKAIDLLQERRTALISAAVTGKIDVHNLANQKAI